MLRDRIQSLIDELGMRRKERLGDKAFAVMMSNFKKDFKIPKNKKWTCIWLWKKSRAQDIIQYFEEKLENTIQGRIEKAAAKPGYQHKRGQLFGFISKRLEELGWDPHSEKVRSRMKEYFGVTSRKDMNNEQLANWLAYLENKVDKI